MSKSIEITQWVLPLASIIGGFLLGIIFERIILRKLEKIANRTKWEGNVVIITALRGMTVFWFVISGIYVAISNLPIDATLLVYLRKILSVAVILSVTIVSAKITVGFVKIYTDKRQGVFPSTSIFTNLSSFLVFLLGSLFILQFLDISITPLLTALGVGGLAVALALQDTLSNLFSGLQIIAARQLRPGNYIKLGSGEEGYVTDITWRNTTIRAITNNRIIVPNSKLASDIIMNYHLPQKEMGILVELGVSYDSDLAKVEKVTIEVAKEVMKEIPGGIPEFEPFIRYHTFADFSINFSVMLRIKEFFDQYLIKHEFIKRLHRRYQDEGIEIPFPIRTVYMKEKVVTS